MTIVYCIGSLATPGGAENVLVNKANYFADKCGYDVHIVIASQNNKPIYYSITKKVAVHNLEINKYIAKATIPLVSFYQNIQKLKVIYSKELQKINPDIIFVLERGYEDFIIPSILKKIPKIRESHSSLEAVAIMNAGQTSYLKNFKERVFTYLYKRQMMQYNHVVLLTERDQKKRTYLKNTSVIPNTITKFKEKASTHVNAIAISVGRLDKFKNFKDQILIWRQIVDKHPNWLLYIYGEGAEKSNLAKLIIKLDLTQNVFLKGKSQNIGAAYSNASIFLFTSLAEGFGIVLVEAMQLGLPVISYDIPCGPSDIIENGVDGFLIKKGDLKAFEYKLLELIENPAKRIKMGTHAIKKSQRYMPEIIMKKWDNLIKLYKDAK